MTSEVIKTTIGQWEFEMGINPDGQLIIYVERLDGKRSNVHKLGGGSFTNEIGKNLSGALFYIDE